MGFFGIFVLSGKFVTLWCKKLWEFSVCGGGVIVCEREREDYLGKDY